MECIATCLDEFSELCRDELESLGANVTHSHYRALQFTCDDEVFYKTHLGCRTASQIYLQVARIPAVHVDVIGRYVQKIDWKKYFHPHQSIRIDANQTNRGNRHLSSTQISKSIRLGMIEALGDVKVDLYDPDIIIHAHVHKRHIIISLNTSGQALHKRGYRKGNHPAPLKENFAAALLIEAGYTGSETLLDPMCGSGTIAIEAAMMAASKVPQIHRPSKNFAFNKLKTYNNSIFKNEQDKFRNTSTQSINHQIYARDIDGSFLENARENALAARVEKHITFAKKNFLESKPPATSGLLISNLPYGKRIDNDPGFFKEVGRKIKFDYKGWRIALLASTDSHYKELGFKYEKKLSFKNGGVDVKFLQCSIY